jgi:hypothetical protein
VVVYDILWKIEKENGERRVVFHILWRRLITRCHLSDQM